MERQDSCDELENDAAYGPDIGFVCQLAIEELGRHEAESAFCLSQIPCPIKLVRYSKVAKFYNFMVLGQQNVLWLQVLVHDLVLVQVDYSIHDLPREAPQLRKTSYLLIRQLV